VGAGAGVLPSSIHEEEPWSGFSKTAAEIVEQRHRDLDAIIRKHPGLAPQLQS
jgi:hypothetical protein